MGGSNSIVQAGGTDGDFNVAFIGGRASTIDTTAPINLDYVSQFKFYTDENQAMRAFQVTRTSDEGVQTVGDLQPPDANIQSLIMEELDLSVIACLRELDVYRS